MGEHTEKQFIYLKQKYTPREEGGHLNEEYREEVT